MPEIKYRQDHIKGLLNLIEENPELKIVPMVDGEIGGDDYAYWLGDWGIAEVDEIYSDDERIYFKKYDEEELIENYCDNIFADEYPSGYIADEIGDKDIENRAKRAVSGLSWKKVITVKINTP